MNTITIQRPQTIKLIGEPTDKLINAKLHHKIKSVEVYGEIYPMNVLMYQFGFTAHKTLKNGK